MQIGQFEVSHEDLILSLAYNYHGNRLVTCSADHRIKLFDKTENDFVSIDEWRAHDSAVTKAIWAHPEFGQVIASSSFDRSVKIWEEVDKRWVERAKLGHAKGSVVDIEFSPNHLGLKIASCSADGYLRIYEALDPMVLSNWTLTEDFRISERLDRESESHFCLSWCPAFNSPPMLVIGCGKENTAKVFRMDPQSNWSCFEILHHSGLVRDVAWAPNMARDHQIIATACTDGLVRIFKLIPLPDHTNGFKVELAAELRGHDSEVWKVDWNITGTILSSSGDDGVVRLWKSNFLHEWKISNLIS